jgi:hypothetical protein
MYFYVHINFAMYFSQKGHWQGLFSIMHKPTHLSKFDYIPNMKIKKTTNPYIFFTAYRNLS